MSARRWRGSWSACRAGSPGSTRARTFFRPPWRRLDRLPQLGHLLGERVPGQKRPGIDNQKQKPVILQLAARDRRAGEEAQGLDREGQTIAFMSAKSGDTAPCRRASVYGEVPVGVEGYARRQCFAGFGGKQYLAHINDAVPMSKMTGPSADGKPKAIGLRL